MKKKLTAACGIIVLTIVCLGVLEFLKSIGEPVRKRYIDHIENSDADSTIGPTEISDGRIVDGTFASHLPVIVIDTGGEQITNYKAYNKETDSFEEPDGVDPYVSMELSVIDSKDHINTLSDTKVVQTAGKIKVRGNSSASSSLPKLQYSVKLLDGSGMNKDVSLLGMGADNSWILNPTVKDISYMRNYLVYNIAGQLEPFQPDVRYCEVLLKKNGQYEYVGLYMLYEEVGVSKNRVDIKKNVSKYSLLLGCLLKKDRYDKNAITLNTWATRQGYYLGDHKDKILGESYFTLEYPSGEKASPGYIESITTEISQIEKLLYKHELRDYKLLEQKLDIDSFVDYFIINEFFANYDAGLYSTFMYKNADGKLSIGPYWDFDGAMDNSEGSLTSGYYMVLRERPWFDCLLKTKEFVEKVQKRYKELRKTLLNEDDINVFIDGSLDYLGNAILRDRSAYSDYYYGLTTLKEPVTGLAIDRRRYTVEDEVQRVKDFIHEHGVYMDKNMIGLEKFVEDPEETIYHTLAGIGFITVFIVVIILVRRYGEEKQ